jgi:hypothetical protein
VPDGTRRFRLLVLLGSLLMIASGFVPWWHSGGDTVNGIQLPASTGIGLEGAGLAIYGAALICLILLDIGYMRGRWGFVLDAPASYLTLGLIAAAALLYRGWELWSLDYIPLPQRSPGLAVAAVGIATLLYGAGSGFGARRYR